MSNATNCRSVVGPLVIAALAVTVWSAVAHAGPTPTPTPQTPWGGVDVPLGPTNESSIAVTHSTQTTSQ